MCAWCVHILNCADWIESNFKMSGKHSQHNMAIALPKAPLEKTCDQEITENLDNKDHLEIVTIRFRNVENLPPFRNLIATNDSIASAEGLTQKVRNRFVKHPYSMTSRNVC